MYIYLYTFIYIHKAKGYTNVSVHLNNPRITLSHSDENYLALTITKE